MEIDVIVPDRTAAPLDQRPTRSNRLPAVDIASMLMDHEGPWQKGGP